MEILSFGGLALPQGDEEVAFPFETLQNLTVLPNGGFDELGQGVTSQPFTIVRTFKITDIAERLAEIGAKMDDLMQVLYGGRRVLRTRWRDGSYRQTFAKAQSAIRPRRQNDRTYQEMTISWYVDYPYWMPTEDEPPYLDNGLFLDAGWTLDGNYSQVTIAGASNEPTLETLTIVNNGLVPVQRGTIVVLPQTGAHVTGLSLRNLANYMWFRYRGTIADPDFLVIDLLSKSVKLSAVNAYEEIEVPPGQLDWFQLEVGTNEIEVDVTSRTGNTILEYHWARQYV